MVWSCCVYALTICMIFLEFCRNRPHVGRQSVENMHVTRSDTQTYSNSTFSRLLDLSLSLNFVQILRVSALDLVASYLDRGVAEDDGTLKNACREARPTSHLYLRLTWQFTELWSSKVRTSLEDISTFETHASVIKWLPYRFLAA